MATHTHLLRIDNSLSLNSQIPLEPQQHDRDFLILVREMPRRCLPPDLLRVDQAQSIADVITDDDKIGVSEGVVVWRGGVGEFEAIGTVIQADIVDKGLVEISEEAEVGRMDALGIAALAEASDGCGCL